MLPWCARCDDARWRIRSRSGLTCADDPSARQGSRRRRADLLDRLPEAERAVADREVRCDLEPTPLDVDEKFTPALRALAHPGLEANEFLLAFGRRADQHQHAFGGLFHPGLQVDPVRPH